MVKKEVLDEMTELTILEEKQSILEKMKNLNINLNFIKTIFLLVLLKGINYLISGVMSNNFKKIGVKNININMFCINFADILGYYLISLILNKYPRKYIYGRLQILSVLLGSYFILQ